MDPKALTEDMLKGWQMAREHYQRMGGVPPYPPGYYDSKLYKPGREGPVADPQPSPEPGTGKLGG